MSEALIESRQLIGWWRDAAPDALTSSAYTGERAIYSSDFSAFTKRPYCPSVFCDFLAQKYHISDTDYPFALRRLPTVEHCSPCGEVPWSIAVVNRRFFGDLHQEISRSWKQPFSSHLINAAAADFTNLVGSVEQGYTAMPVVEDTLASHLSPSLAPSWKSRPLLPTKPCRTTSALIGKSYIAAGQADMALHTMAILQAYQADMLKEMDEGTGLTPEAVKELRRATDLALRANKHTARAVGRSMAGSVAAERRLWLNLTEIREREVFLLDAPISQSGLFGEAVSSVVEKFRSAKTQSAALKQFMPRRTRDHSTPSSSLSREQSLPRKEPSGRSGAQAAHPPPTMVWGARGRSFPRQRPRRRVDLKRPNRPATSAPPSRSWPSGRNEESRLTATRRDQTAKAYLPASNAFSSLKSVTTTPRGLVCRINHQILLSTLSSLDITGIPLRWFESYLTGRSFRVAWGGEVSKAHKLVTGVPQGSVLGPLLFSTYTTSLAPIIQAHGFSYHFYADDTQLYLSFRPDDPTVTARISGCLADISAWMKENHLQLNLAKTELLVFPATPTLQHDFTIQLGSSTITPSASVRNLGVIFDDQLTFKEHIAKTARSCRFALHNIRKIRPFLTEHAAQLLVQALVISRLDYCNALLAGLPSNTIKPLQMIQNAAARLVFNEPKRAHVTPLFVSLHWLPVAARIQFKTLMLAYRTTTGSAPTYFHSLLRTYIPSRSLRSASERRLVVPSQRGSKSLSRTFSFTVPGRWNDLPTPIRNAGSLSIFKQQLKTHLFQLYLTT